VTRAADLRRLAAIDIVFLGFTFVVAEYVLGVLLSVALGLFVLVRSHSLWQVTLGAYLICVGINYTPMFLYSISIANRNNARAELGTELIEKRNVMAKYRRISLLLLVPLVPPVLAVCGRGDSTA
jgi:hypothetical protein